MSDDTTHHDAFNPLIEYLMNVVGKTPASSEHEQAQPAARAGSVAKTASINAGITSGALALPPGPLGWLTVLPDVVAIWKIQAQLVADIAAIHGKSKLLTRENMLYCLFRHSATLAVRELVVQVGTRVLVRPVSADVIRSVVRRISVKLSQKIIGESLSRWVPIVGAVGVGAFAYYDTSEVARTAIEFFKSDIAIEAGESSVVTLQAFNGQYVASDSNSGTLRVGERAERFKISHVVKDEQTVALLAANGKWWCCDGDSACQILANREKLDAWETFKIERVSDTEIALRAHNGRLVYVDAERGNTLWGDKEASELTTVFKVEYFKDA